jgi:predicted O-methyltransferase YrrM
MIAEGESDFDLIYIDASHYAVDVLTDAVLSFRLLRGGGMMIFDDYLWSGDENIVYYPKIAIDAFTNVFSKHLRLVPAPITQIYAIKINEFIKE